MTRKRVGKEKRGKMSPSTVEKKGQSCPPHREGAKPNAPEKKKRPNENRFGESPLGREITSPMKKKGEREGIRQLSHGKLSRDRHSPDTSPASS